MIITKLRQYLDEHCIKYITISHPRAYTAQEIAHLVHVKGKEMAKSVMVRVDDETAMAVLPASYNIDFHLLSTAIHTPNVYLEDEKEFAEVFPDCEVGAMPPFGNLYGIPVYVAESLADDEEIVFNAGTHTELIKMAFADYRKLVNPKILSFSVPREENPATLLHQ